MEELGPHFPAASEDAKKGPATPLPWAQIIPVYITLWCEAFNSSSIFAYVGFMVLDFGLSKDEQDPSYMYYAGLLGSSFFAAQLLSSFFWGALSDRWGRRPVLLFGQVGSFLSMAFGFSFNFSWAMCARSLNGLLNGTTGVSKTCLAEICDSTNSAKAFGWIGLMWGFGSICGSILGGVLARPALKYPSVFSPTGIFAKFPYLLPNLAASLVTLIGIVLCYFFLKENPRRSHAPSAAQQALDTQLENELELKSMSLSVDNIGGETSEMKETQDNLKRTHSFIDLDPEEGPAVIGGYAGLESGTGNLKWYQKGVVAKCMQLPAYLRTVPIFHEWSPAAACIVYALFGCLQTMADEVWPLWARTPVSEGGLAFTTDQIGLINAWGGVIQLLFNAICYPFLANRFGLIATFSVGALTAGLTYPLFPLLKYVPLPVKGDIGSYIAFWFFLGLLMAVRQVASQAGFSSVMTLISNSVYPENMGAANGLGQSLVAATRTFAPFIGSAILAVSLRPSAIFPFNHGRAAWFVVGAFSLSTLLVAIKLPKGLNKPKIEAEAEKNAKLKLTRLVVDSLPEEISSSTSSDSLQSSNSSSLTDDTPSVYSNGDIQDPFRVDPSKEEGFIQLDESFLDSNPAPLK